ncbi:MAG: glycosyltransferase family 2 protein [Candidatus Omnitrophica bacterium]|nr:glycosyltransferase family 2 protein [Candidatus Omnitrophota bacterium]MCM8802022.1 glycosyltransferase family 2 protein [Candidatus Omnitrophota bacterium]
MKKYDLCIAYRINAQNSRKKRPVFQNDKFKLATLSLESFKRSLGDLKFKLIVIFDRCPLSYEKIFLQRFRPEELEFIHIERIMDKYFGNNAFTFLKQIEILVNQQFSENVYFAEDDYLYIPNGLITLLDFFHKTKVDFVTPYDHPDYYTLNLHKYKKEVIQYEYGNYVWRSVGSTCCTFLTTVKTLQETRSTLEKYKFISDAPMWFILTKKRQFFAPKFLEFNFFIWTFGLKQLLFGKRYTLYAPQPSIATHMEEKFLAPGVDWYSYMKILLREIFKT